MEGSRACLAWPDCSVALLRLGKQVPSWDGRTLLFMCVMQPAFQRFSVGLQTTNLGTKDGTTLTNADITAGVATIACGGQALL